MKLDFQKVREAADICRLADFLGLPVERKGGERYISCPLHDDRHPSCMIRPGQKHAYCFVCGEAISCYDLVMYVNGVSFSDAVETVWQSEGCPPGCVTEEREEREENRAFFLSPSEMEFLGIHFSPRVQFPVRETENREFLSSEMPGKGSYAVSADGGYLAEDSSDLLSWNSFLSERDMKEMVRNHCSEQEEKYRKLSLLIREETGEAPDFSERMDKIRSLKERASC